MGYIDYTNGNVWSDTDADNLMVQSVIRCTSGTRPPTGLGDGTLIFETDTRLYRAWNSLISQWVVFGTNYRTAVITQVLTSTGTTPGPGSGVIRQGHYTRGPGGMVHFTFYYEFGTSPTAGTGQYLMSIPITAAVEFGGTNPEWFGSCRVTDFGTQTYTGVLYIPGSNPNVVSMQLGNSIMSAGTPFTIATGDMIAGSISYRAANGS